MKRNPSLVGMLAVLGASFFSARDARSSLWTAVDCAVQDVQTVKIAGQRTHFVFSACGPFFYIPWDENHKTSVALVLSASLSGKHVNLANQANGNPSANITANIWSGNTQVSATIWQVDTILMRD